MLLGEGTRHKVDSCVDIGGHLRKGADDWDNDFAAFAEGFELGNERAFCPWGCAEVSVEAPSAGQVVTNFYMYFFFFFFFLVRPPQGWGSGNFSEGEGKGQRLNPSHEERTLMPSSCGKKKEKRHRTNDRN